MDNPERRAEEDDAVNEHVLALIEIDELWTHTASDSEHTFFGRYVIVCHPKEGVAIAEHFSVSIHLLVLRILAGIFV